MTLELQGIVPPLVTPFDEREEVDETALRQEIAYHLDAGVDGICVGGSTGEGATLSLEDAVVVARAAVHEVAGRVPVIAGIIRDSTREVIRYGLALRETGVDALQVTPVHYLFTPGGPATVTYYREITEAVNLPVVVYNVVPWATIPPPILVELLRDVPLVAGIKQSGGDIHALASLLTNRPDRGRILTAIDDLLYPSFILGADGAISALLTVAPALAVELWRVVRKGDHRRARAIHQLLLPIWAAVNAPNMPARIKYALSLQGRFGGRPRSPMDPLTDGDRRAIDDALRYVLNPNGSNGPHRGESTKSSHTL